MNQEEALRAVLMQAQLNGFPFRRWFQTHLCCAWPGSRQAIVLLATGDRYYTLLFSHDFARYFWRVGSKISFVVPAVTYPRVNSQGGVIEVTRKSFTRRNNKPNAWKYHLSQMAASDDPLAYICRFLPAQIAPSYSCPVKAVLLLCPAAHTQPFIL